LTKQVSIHRSGTAGATGKYAFELFQQSKEVRKTMANNSTAMKNQAI